jgi:hypothetical protein
LLFAPGCEFLFASVVEPVLLSVIVAPQALQVLKPVVGLVPVDVVEFVAFRDGAVGVLPNPTVFELVNVSSAFVPAKKPVSILQISIRLVSPLSLVVGSTRLVAVDALISGVTGFPFLPTCSAHETQRL